MSHLDGEEARCEPCCQSPNREGVTTLARDLRALDVELYATDGTREHLAADGVEVASVAELTDGSPAVGGQVKTFHPAVYAGILARRDIPEQLDELASQGIGLIDIVVVNVKPFAPPVGARLVGLDEAIEMIDVGGAALLGAAARNSAGVAAASDPSHYRRIVPRSASSVRSARARAQLAAEAFSTVAAYHAEIAAYLNQVSGNTFPKRLAIVLEKVGDLRYGENPHQRAAVLPRDHAPRAARSPTRRRSRASARRSTTCSTSTPRYRIARDYTAPDGGRRRSTPDPVGLASDDELVEAYRHALETDPVASFGGIVGVNRELDGATAREIAESSYEAVDRARATARRPSASCARSPASSSSPVPRRPHRGHARLRHRQPRLQARRAAGCSSRRSTSSASTAASSRSSPSAGRRSRS